MTRATSAGSHGAPCARFSDDVMGEVDRHDTGVAPGDHVGSPLRLIQRLAADDLTAAVTL